jgi:hypothetical protein
MPLRPPPVLEWLEGRLAPAGVRVIPGDGEADSAHSAPLEAVPPQELAGPVAEMAEPFAVFVTASVPPAVPTGSTQVFFSTPAPPDPLMSQIGRLREPSLAFPASGGGGEVVRSEELGYLPPAAPPREAEPAEQAEAEGEGEEAEPPPPAETEMV